MTVVRDYAMPYERAQAVLSGMGMANSSATLSEGTDPLAGLKSERVLMLTSMSSGWMGYHQKFLNDHRQDVQEWVVVLVDSDSTSMEQLQMHFAAAGVRVRLFITSSEGENWGVIGEQIRSLPQIHYRKALLYSVRPHCGKKTLAALLARFMPDWTFETREEDLSKDILMDSDAGKIMILGKAIPEFQVPIPQGVQPFYVLTMPDQNVQTWLQRAVLPLDLLKYIPGSLGWSMETARERFFVVSPLFETWRLDGMEQIFDPRFVIWDSFGLPILKNTGDAYPAEETRAFLSRFTEGEALAHALRL